MIFGVFQKLGITIACHAADDVAEVNLLHEKEPGYETKARAPLGVFRLSRRRRLGDTGIYGVEDLR